MTLPTVAAVPDSSVLVLGGMHRSGTSLLASLFEGAGLSVGLRLLGGGTGNDAGHFEDLDFQEFHQRVLLGNGLSADGFTAAARPCVPLPLRDEADRLVKVRREQRSAWGWKDPRTILFLDFWAELLPDARYVFVFRPPWEVADSFFRRGDPAFVYNPLLAVPVWLHYNQRILRFVAERPDACIVRELAQIVAHPSEVVATVRDRFGMALGEPPDRFRPDLLCTAADGRRPRLVEAVYPEAIDVYRCLQGLAGSAVPRPPVTKLSDAELAVLEWAKAARLEQENEAVRRDWMAIRAAADAEVAALRGELAASAAPPAAKAA
ncbi:MAG: hypothetical protein ACKO4T_14660 [Planctomycetaceae bacterium]